MRPTSKRRWACSSCREIASRADRADARLSSDCEHREVASRDPVGEVLLRGLVRRLGLRDALAGLIERLQRSPIEDRLRQAQAPGVNVLVDRGAIARRYADRRQRAARRVRVAASDGAGEAEVRQQRRTGQRPHLAGREVLRFRLLEGRVPVERELVDIDQAHGRRFGRRWLRRRGRRCLVGCRSRHLSVRGGRDQAGNRDRDGQHPFHVRHLGYLA